MNKGLISYFTIISLITFHTYSMEIDIIHTKGDPSLPNSDIYCLANMSKDIHNYIAEILTWHDESQEEFIERTKIVKKIPKHCYSFLSTNDELPNHDQGALPVFSPDETKMASLSFPFNRVNPNLIIIDLQKNNDTEKVMHKGPIEQSQYECIALSCSGKIVAMYHKKMVPSHRGENMCRESRLEIQKIGTQEKKALIAHSIEPKIVSFNKQGTLVIAHGKDWRTKQDTYLIFPLKNVDPNKPQPIIDDTNKLLTYLRDKRVCNNCIKS